MTRRVVSSSLVSVALCLVVVLSTGPAVADWKYVSPMKEQPDVHRAFAFAKDNDDRLEFACLKGRVDMFYTTPKTVSQQRLQQMKSGKTQLLIRVEGTGLARINAHRVYQRSGRLVLVTGVKAALVEQLGRATKSFAAGLQSGDQIHSQALYPIAGLRRAM
ncbi:MAG: hypothetical protein AAFY64_12100, partial [Pseudomonadota bacterium]